jgi:hypothetical protein
VRLAALLFGLVTLAQPLRTEENLLVCRMTGAVMQACCCPAPPTSPGAALKVRSCCDALHVESTVPPSRVDGAAAPIPAPVAIDVAIAGGGGAFAFVTMVDEVALRRPPTTAGPPRLPLYLSLRRLLD